MTNHPDIGHFTQATNEETMRDLMQPKLKDVWGDYIRLTAFRVTRVFPRKDGGFTIQYELSLMKSKRGRERKKILCGYLMAPSETWPDYIGNTSGGLLLFKDLRLVVPIFPFDNKLPNLAKFIAFKNNSKLVGHLESIFGKDRNIEISRCEVLGYRLEKRCVIRYTLASSNSDKDQTRVIVKLFRPSRLHKALDSMKILEKGGFHLGTGDGLSIPEIYGSDEESGAIFMESAPGSSLHNLLKNIILKDGCIAAAKLLRKLRSLDAKNLKVYMILDELGNIRRNIELIGHMFPEFKDQFDKTFDALTEAQIEETENKMIAHRDFYDKQVLYSENRTTLIDCDNIAIADPALDYGNFVAHLELRKLQHPEAEDNIEKGRKAFMENYEIPDEGFIARSYWWTAATFLRLAALYALRPRWRSLAPGILDKAVATLNKKPMEGK